MAELKGGSVILPEMTQKGRAEALRRTLIASQPKDWATTLEAAELVCLEYYGFKTLREFVTRPMSEKGLGLTPEKAKALLAHNKNQKETADKLIAKLELSEQAKAVEEAKQHGTNRHSNSRGYNSTNITSRNDKPNQNRGTGLEYRISVLKRDHPEVAARLEAGEFKTVAEAQRAAGVKEPRRKLLGRFSWFEGDTQGFVDDIKERLGPELVQELALILSD